VIIHIFRLGKVTKMQACPARQKRVLATKLITYELVYKA
jgi:hypothetical protein